MLASPMNGSRATIILVTVAVVAGASVVGYWLGNLVESRVSTRPLEAPAGSLGDGAAESSPAMSAMPSMPSLAVPSPSPSPSAMPSIPPPAAAVVLEPVLRPVRPGIPLVVRWRIDGPSGTLGASTRLVASLEGASEVVSPAVRSFSVPARFEATVTPAHAGMLTLTAEANLEGRVLRSHATLRVIE